MKRIRQSIFFAVALAAATGCQGGIDAGACGWDEAAIGQGCTVIYMTDGETSLGGNNEDYVDPLTRVWFVPGEDGGYGRVYFSYDNFFPQGGMNDQGLFFDAMAVDEQVTVPQGDRESYGYQLADIIMAECATVACAIDYFETYHLADTWAHQFLFGDATGNSAIIEPLTVLPLEGSYQVGTNFYQSTTSAQASGCWRYPIATTMLEAADDVSVEVMRDVLDAAHIGEGSPTLYSNVYDLNNRLVYLYLFHDYENVVVIDLEEELALGPHAYEIAALFPPNARWEAWASERLERYEQVVEANLDSTVDPNAYDALTGQYELGEDSPLGPGVMTVVRDGNALWMQFPGGRQYRLYPQSETSFFHVSSGHGYEIDFTTDFTLGEDGRAANVRVNFGETPFDCERTETAEPPPFISIIDPGAAVPEPTEAPVETPDSAEAPPDAESEDSAALLWIGAALAVIFAGGVGMFVGLRRGRSGGSKGEKSP